MTLEFISRNLEREKGKWQSGMKSQYFKLKDFSDKFTTAMELYGKKISDESEEMKKEREKKEYGNRQ